MADHFFDTSAATKHYQAEAGTAVVEGLIATAGRNIVSRLAGVELHSALAKRVRSGHMTRDEFERVTRRFRRDVRAKRWEVVRLLVRHYERAERLIRRHAVERNLRTLDALQLAVALDLNAASPVVFVSADQALCGVAADEGLEVINPEAPPPAAGAG